MRSLSSRISGGCGQAARPFLGEPPVAQAPWPPDEAAAYLERTEHWKTAIVTMLGGSGNCIGVGPETWAARQLEAGHQIKALGVKRPKTMKREFTVPDLEADAWN